MQGGGWVCPGVFSWCLLAPALRVAAPAPSLEVTLSLLKLVSLVSVEESEVDGSLLIPLKALEFLSSCLAFGLFCKVISHHLSASAPAPPASALLLGFALHVCWASSYLLASSPSLFPWLRQATGQGASHACPGTPGHPPGWDRPHLLTNPA